MFLVLSVACFSAGLVAFAYSSQQVVPPHGSQFSICRLEFQHYVTSTLTTVFSAFTSFGLAAVSAWFIFERIVFSQHEGKKWLAEILDDASEKIKKVTGYRWVKKTAPGKSKIALTWSAQIFRRVMAPLRRIGPMFGRSSGRVGNVDTSIPPPHSPTILPTTSIMPSRTYHASPAGSVVQSQLDREDEKNSDEAGVRPSEDSLIASPTTSPPSPEPGAEVSAARARFMNLVQNVIMVNKLIRTGDEAKAKVSISLTDDEATDREQVAVESSRITGLVPRLRSMTPTKDIGAHAASVRHIQASINQVMMSAPIFNYVP